MKQFVIIFSFIILTTGMIFAQGAGNALNFDGAEGDYVNCGNSSTLKPSDVLTIEAWVRPGEGSHMFPGGNGVIISDGDGSATGVTLDLQSTRVPYCIINTAAGTKTVSGNSVSENTWEHVAFVFSNAGISLFQNGSLVNSLSFTSTIVTTTNDLHIGGRPTDSDRRFIGDIDEVRIWHAPLIGSVINTWKSKSITASHPNYVSLVSYYKFDEDRVGLSSGNCVDSKGSNTAPNNGATWFANNDLALPVELTSFTALPAREGNKVELHWVTASELDNLGFEIVRREGTGQPWQVIASYATFPQLKGQGTVSHETRYDFTDPAVENKAYQYCVVSVDVNGDREYSQVVDISLANFTASDFTLYPAYPNPFNPSTVITYYLKEEANVSLRVIDVNGRTVRTLSDGIVQTAGSYSLTWEGYSDGGTRISSGVYFIIMQAGQFTGSQKVLFLK